MINFYFIQTFNFTFVGAQFQCPNDKSGQFKDTIQCDKYCECDDGVATEKLCPDGLVFDETIRLKNKCDQPFNVDCEDRTELRKCQHKNSIVNLAPI